MSTKKSKPHSETIEIATIMKTLAVMGEWREICLDELADFRNGKAISPARYVSYGKYPVFGANGQIARSDEVLYEEPVVVIGRVGAYCGAVHYVSGPSWVKLITR